MSTAWLLARRELGVYFATPAGWVLLAIYLLATGLLFNGFALGAQPKLSQQALEDFFYYASGMSMIAAVLLSMRLVAEERQTRTLVLLRTAPVTERAIVWGKFLSAALFYAILVAATGYLPALILVHGKVTLAHILTGYLGLLLLGSACIAVTLLASALSRTQLMAGVLGALMVGLLTVAWMLARVTEEPLRTVLNHLALHNLHFQPFARGTLPVRDVVFYLGVTTVFLEGAVRAMEAWRWRQ